MPLLYDQEIIDEIRKRPAEEAISWVEQELDKTTPQDPRYYNLLYGMLKVYRSSRDFQAAGQKLEEYLAREPADQPVKYNLRIMLCRYKGKYDHLPKQSAKADKVIAREQQKRTAVQEVLEIFEAAKKAGMADDHTYSFAASTVELLNEADGLRMAEDIFKQAERDLKPPTSGIYVNWAATLWNRRGHSDRHLKLMFEKLDTAIKIEGTYKDAHRVRIRRLLETRKIDAAQIEMTDYLKHNPDLNALKLSVNIGMHRLNAAIDDADMNKGLVWLNFIAPQFLQVISQQQTPAYRDLITLRNLTILGASPFEVYDQVYKLIEASPTPLFSEEDVSALKLDISQTLFGGLEQVDNNRHLNISRLNEIIQTLTPDEEFSPTNDSRFSYGVKARQHAEWRAMCKRYEENESNRKGRKEWAIKNLDRSHIRLWKSLSDEGRPEGLETRQLVASIVLQWAQHNVTPNEKWDNTATEVFNGALQTLSLSQASEPEKTPEQILTPLLLNALAKGDSPEQALALRRQPSETSPITIPGGKSRRNEPGGTFQR